MPSVQPSDPVTSASFLLIGFSVPLWPFPRLLDGEGGALVSRASSSELSADTAIEVAGHPLHSALGLLLPEEAAIMPSGVQWQSQVLHLHFQQPWLRQQLLG